MIARASRLPVIVVGTLLVNVLLFTGIEAMVGLRQIRLTDTSDIQIANFIRMAEQSRDVRSRRDPKAPQKPRREVQQDVKRLSQAATNGLNDIAVEFPDIDIEIDLGGGIQIARELTPLVRVPPEYPIRALAKGIEGYVLLRFIVTETGNVQDPEVLRAEPPQIFDRAAKQAVRRWKFQPQFKNGKPIPVITYSRIRFEMMGEGEPE